MNESTRRAPTKSELEILSKLLQVPFPGSTELAEQLKGIEVEDTSDNDNYGSIKLYPKHNVRADVDQRVPVEAVAYDSDNVRVEILLHVQNGLLNELEVIKTDGTPLRGQIFPGNMEIKVG